MKLQKGLINLFFLFVATLNSNCQSKTSNWISGSLNKQNNELLVISNNSNIFQKISFGVGVGFGFDTKFSKKASLNYGLNLVTHNNLIAIGDIASSISNTSFQIPVSLKYNLHLKSKNIIVLMSGVNMLIQGGNSTQLSSDDYVLKIEKESGLFPLFHGALGYSWKKRGEHQILLKYNYGFRRTGSQSIYQNENLVYKLNLTTTYFEFEYRIVINKSP